MLQTLLAERFKLAIHHEMRDQPVYALTVGKGGPKLKQSPTGDTLDPAAERPRMHMINGEMHMDSPRMTMTQLSAMLTTFVGRPDRSCGKKAIRRLSAIGSVTIPLAL